MKRALATIAICAVAVPVLAQDGNADWAMVRDARKKLTVAYTRFDNGLGIATRCLDGSYQALITGLPPAGPHETRTLRVAYGDEDMHDQRWSVAIDDTVAVSDLPAPFARRLREGGRLRVLVPGAAEGGRNLVYDLTLPVSRASIDETLTVCDRPLTDPRDAELAALPEGGLPAELTWAEQPRPDFPQPIRFARGYAVVMCLANPDGSLRDCSVEAEHPQEAGFGDAALRASRRARVANVEDSAAPVAPARILYRNQFIVNGYQTREDEERFRAQRQRDREARQRREPRAQ